MIPRSLAVALAVPLVAACGLDGTFGSTLAVGTWGGEQAGVIVTDDAAHVHIGCTYGDFPAPIPLDDGRFSVDGDYLLRAHPVAVGPTMPARFAGIVEGVELVMTVAVDDTIAGETVLLGPVTVKLGDEPKLGPCPICAM
jgi:hypothetical protein